MFPVQIFTALGTEFRPQIIGLCDAHFFTAMLAFELPDSGLVRIGNHGRPAEGPSAVAVGIPAALGGTVFLHRLPRIKRAAAHGAFPFFLPPSGNDFFFSGHSPVSDFPRKSPFCYRCLYCQRFSPSCQQAV